MRLPIYQIDAFTSAAFGGNPAAVVPLDTWLPDATLQAIAMENNLSETAFFVPPGPQDDGAWGLRWFTPAVEVDLCGHATLATAHLMMNILHPGTERVVFRTQKAGLLTVVREEGRLTLDFPARPPQTPDRVHDGLIAALGGPAPVAILAARDYLVVYDDAAAVRALTPDMAGLLGIDRFAVIVTAPGDEPGVDFVSRFFAPAKGVPEDPVTGSAHCTLIPYWAQRLNADRLSARQVSRRGGALTCRLDGDRVRIGGDAVLFLEGYIHI
ncbi:MULTISPECIES: PhzF family phenazine biosynthesis protein [Nitrospirillum]|uniref:PhzF family phenazine biosynthesis protein n=1 Tax=Nitrospirillum amazonense TaxID=28077 RepID=A0A560FZP3_9PROT|nr:PhzF family phenazine biosynthesis protein [Nitrospirillum amazonense]MEC4591085.1 PhzF family phenazine biosynthesis protein [Nitrospirillum amazonense]TWB27106.1 PhzF family phenazine biosynthesis protein [Nitrospirillum amazonense]